MQKLVKDSNGNRFVVIRSVGKNYIVRALFASPYSKAAVTERPKKDFVSVAVKSLRVSDGILLALVKKRTDVVSHPATKLWKGTKQLFDDGKLEYIRLFTYMGRHAYMKIHWIELSEDGSRIRIIVSKDQSVYAGFIS